jgi:cell division protease FtsH
LENLLNEAALLAARENKRLITMTDVERATLKVIAGPEKKSKVVRDHDRKLFAYHEAGHAVVVKYLTTHDPVHQISIVPRGMAGGMNIFLPKEDKASMSRTEMLERLTSCLGGRVAEQLILGDISTGASNDIKKATEIARGMVTKYGMSEKLGPVLYGSDSEVFLGRDYGHMRNYSESVANQIDEEIKAFIKEAYKRCEEILSKNLGKLHGIAAYLLENETMDGAAFETYMETGELPDKEADPEPPPPAFESVLSDLPILDELPELEDEDE